MKSAAVVALLASGCTFSIPIENTSDAAPDDARRDASTMDMDAILPIDAPPDAPPTWILLETIVVPCDGTEMTSTNPLAGNTIYRLRVSGSCPINTLGLRGDADYGFNVGMPFDEQQEVDIGLAINDTTVGGDKLPDWGSYTSSHDYTAMWTGLGAPIVAKFHDPNYENNSGSLMLYIDSFQ